MTANALRRYSVGNRTPGITKPDGSLRDIVVSRTRPQDPDVVWLPSPEAPFYLMMRLYGPGESIQTGRWKPPAIVPQPR
ncbi:DUF1214 domain-containing protein [Novosphingobium sp. P6W]|nr:DUF1214 domain-containing protein [Novosphingobium sp. P6W]